MKLREYLRSEGLKINAFASKVGVTSATINNVMNGKEPRLSIAIAIEDATNGQVTCRDLLPDSKAESMSESALATPRIPQALIEPQPNGRKAFWRSHKH